MTRYLSLAEYFWLAEQVTGGKAEVLAKASQVDLADSALHAPEAGVGDDDFYPDLIDKGRGADLPTGLEPPTARWQQARCVGGADHVPRPERLRVGARSSSGR